MWKNKSAFNNFHSVFNILDAKIEKMNAYLRLFAENLVEKPGKAWKTSPLWGKPVESEKTAPKGGWYP